MLSRVLKNVLRDLAAYASRETLTPQRLTELANAHAAQGQHAAAAGLYERALRADPQYAAAHNNYALSLTALGRLREAWAESEWRFQLQEQTRHFFAQAPIPRWRGEALPSGALVVLWEQGAGDMLQHLRFLPLAAERVRHLAFLCPEPLRRLVQASFPRLELVRASAPVRWSDYAAFSPLLSLPHALGVHERDLPDRPYLRAPEPAPGASPAGVGIVWRASDFDPARNCSLEDFSPLAASGHALASLQTLITPAERATLHAWRVQDLGSGFGDFLDTACAM